MAAYQAMLKARLKAAEKLDYQIINFSMKVGQQVLLKKTNPSSKFDYTYEGSYTVLESDPYTVKFKKDPNSRKTFHVHLSQIKPYSPSSKLPENIVITSNQPQENIQSSSPNPRSFNHKITKRPRGRPPKRLIGKPLNEGRNELPQKRTRGRPSKPRRKPITRKPRSDAQVQDFG
uniref:YDG domain-containing protein n=1 Tax=Strongyloides venezuelensis TaxID=75913 RepID=A0A0K0FFW0_STRVS